MKAKIFGSLAMATMISFFALAVFSPKFINAQEPSPDAQTDMAPPSEAEEVLPPDIQSNAALLEIINLSQAGVSEDVISNYIYNVQYRFNLTASQIIYLKDIGLPDSLVLAMQQRDQQLGENDATPPPQAAPAPPPPTTVVTENYFYDSLAPYGSWVYVEGYGRCWRPSVVVYDSGWQPYCNGGHWVWTDCGWYWYSDYSWGWAPFHYGRWFHHARFGWCWYPDTVWGPSWVCWRYSNNYCGWAPLPPHCDYRPGVGLVFNGAHVSVGFDFGLSVGAFTFVATRDFCDPHPWRHRIEHQQAAQVFNQTTVINNITVNNHGNNNTTIVNGGGQSSTTVINNGIPVEHIAAVTHRQFRPLRIQGTTTPVRRGEQIHNDSIVVNRPHFESNPAKRIDNDHAHTIPSPTTGAPMQVPPPNATQNRNNTGPGREQFRNPNDNRNLPNRNPAPPTVIPQTPVPNHPTVQPSNPNQNRNENPGNRNRVNVGRFGSTLPETPTTPSANENQRNNFPNRNQQQPENRNLGSPVQNQPPVQNGRAIINPPPQPNPNRPSDNNRNLERQNVPPTHTPPVNNNEIRRTEPATPALPAENRRNWQQPSQPAQPPQVERPQRGNGTPYTPPQRNYEPPRQSSPQQSPPVVTPSQTPQQQQSAQQPQPERPERGRRDRNDQ